MKDFYKSLIIRTMIIVLGFLFGILIGKLIKKYDNYETEKQYQKNKEPKYFPPNEEFEL